MSDLLREFEEALPAVQGADFDRPSVRIRKRKRVERFPIPEEEQEQILDRATANGIDAELEDADAHGQAELRQYIQRAREQDEERSRGRRGTGSRRSRSQSRSAHREPDPGAPAPRRDPETAIRPTPCIVCSWERGQLPIGFAKDTKVLFVTLRQNILMRSASRAAVPNFLDGLMAVFDAYARDGELKGCLLWYFENVTKESIMQHFRRCCTNIVLQTKLLADQFYDKITMAMKGLICYEMTGMPEAGDGAFAMREALDPVQVGCVIKLTQAWTKLASFRFYDSPFFDDSTYIPNEAMRVKNRALIHASKLKMGDPTPPAPLEERADAAYIAENPVLEKLGKLMEEVRAMEDLEDPALDAASTLSSAEHAFGFE